MQFIPYSDFVNDMVGKRDLYEKGGEDVIQTLSEKTHKPVYGQNTKEDVNDQLKYVTENWMR